MGLSNITHLIMDYAYIGAFAGFVARLLTAPFDFVKIRIQLQSPSDIKYTSISHAFRTITRDEGITAFWKVCNSLSMMIDIVS